MAGLFALFVGMFMIGSKAATGFRDGVKRDHAIKYAQDNNRLMYTIGSQDYFLANHKPCRLTYTDNGHKVIIGTGKYHGQIFYDYDKGKEETLSFEFEKALERAKAEGMKYLNIIKYEDYADVEYGSGVYYEIETQKKYSLQKSKFGGEDVYRVYYLENEPINATKTYGGGGSKVKKYMCLRDSDGNEISKKIDEKEYWKRHGAFKM